MPGLIPSDLPTIMQSVEQQLLNYVSTITSSAVIGSIQNVFWVFQGEEPPPGQIGQRDILLAEREDVTTNVQGAGRFTEIYSGLSIHLRSSQASDYRGTKKDWMIAHRRLVNALMDSMMDFFPVDADNNALTIEGFVLGGPMNGNGNATPAQIKDTKKWGQTVGIYRFHYIPNIDLAVLDPTP